ncbi:hypothetical protein ACP26L_21125 [Paenibacillus sp. S-38]|uniref:hypothetical protein n=1 Tax=Paenibacillus sp. S-38 TaxID=3416710 RepID=UPI003CF1A43D
MRPERATDLPRVHCGSFEAEQFWRPDGLVKLPGLPDPAGWRMVSAMDELLFAFCREGDTLLTRSPMNAAHLQYLAELGFAFRHNRLPLDESGANPHLSVPELLAGTGRSTLAECMPGEGILEPFAVIPGTEEAARALGLSCPMPPMETITRVNTKMYSAEMRERLGLRNPAVTVRSSGELAAAGRALLAEGPFLIKDNFGVSGQGNLLIDSEGVLDRITAHTAGQEKKGRRTEYVLETLLPKAYDFSCQFHVGEDGSVRILSVQRLANSEFAYEESYTPEPHFLQELEEQGYFGLMESIGRELHRDGYFGHVCIDSMGLVDGELAPLVEINARKSMSLIKHGLDRFLQEAGLQGNLRSCTLPSLPPGLAFEDLLAALDREGVLYRPGRDGGVLPLTANTLTVNRSADHPFKGRLYICSAGRDREHGRGFTERLFRLLETQSLEFTR